MDRIKEIRHPRKQHPLMDRDPGLLEVSVKPVRMDPDTAGPVRTQNQAKPVFVIGLEPG